MMRRARVPQTLPYDGEVRRGTKSGTLPYTVESHRPGESGQVPTSKYESTLERHRGQRRMHACSALGRAAEEGARRRRMDAELNWRRPHESDTDEVTRRSAFAPPQSNWPELSLSDAPLDVARFEEMLLIRDERGMRRDGSKYLEQLAKEYPDEPHRIVLAARRVFDVFARPVPLTDRALIIVVRYAVKIDFRTAMQATRVLILQYPKSRHTPNAMLVAASIQRHAGHLDKANQTLANLHAAYPQTSAATRAAKMLAANAGATAPR